MGAHGSQRSQLPPSGEGVNLRVQPQPEEGDGADPSGGVGKGQEQAWCLGRPGLTASVRHKEDVPAPEPPPSSAQTRQP